MKTIFKLVLLIGLLCSLHSYAFENRDIRFLTIQDGLSDNSVNSILKDSDGFMWFATDNGISRYDGRNIENFYLPFEKKQQITQLYEVNEEYLWVSTSHSLYALHREDGSFLPIINEQTGNPVYMHRILRTNNNLYWGIHQNNVFTFKLIGIKQGKLSIHIQKETRIAHSEGVFSSFCFSSDSTEVYLTTDRLTLRTLSTSSLSLSNKTYKLHPGTASTSAMIADKQYIWAATMGQGVLRFNKQSNQCQQFIFNENRANSSLSHISAYNLLQIHQNLFFVPTWNGYSLLKVDDENNSQVTCDIHDNNSFLDIPAIETRMISTYYDPQYELLWIGTRGGGVLLWDIRKKVFKQYNQKRHNEIISIQADVNHHIWLATYHEGLMRSKEPFNNPYATLEFESIRPHTGHDKAIPYCSVKGIDGDLWFGYSSADLLHWSGTHNRLQTYNLSNCKVSNGKKLAGINCLFMDNQYRLWLGTYHGLFLFNSKDGKCTEVPLTIQGERRYLNINHICQGLSNVLWVGTSTGVCRISIQGNQSTETYMGYEQQKQIPVQSVNSLLIGDDQNIYAAYSGGFAVISQTRNEITDFYTTKNGLPSNEVNCLAKDGNGRIWIGSNSAISRYSRHQRIFHNYYISGSNRSAVFICNFLFFGNNKSLTYFNPQELLQTSKINKVQFTNLEINHQKVAIHQLINNQTILKKAITYTDTIALNYINRDFSLVFSTLTFHDDKQSYAYRLLPYQKQWVRSHEGEKAVYTNLPEGEYQFEVKAVYPDDVESEVSTLHITVHPHWSRSTWFLTILILLLFSLLLFLFHRIKKKQKQIRNEMLLKHQLEIACIKEAKEKELKEEQEVFFTNAAHELRTPLTLILGPLQDVLNFSPLPLEIKEKSKLALQNAESLLSLTNQLLYVQKIEANMVKLRLAEVNLNELIYQEYLFFSPLASQQNKEFNIHMPKGAAMLWVDSKQITSAVRNLLSNAFKYTAEGGVIELSLTEADETHEEFYIITVADNGGGIPLPLQERVFDSFITGQHIASFSDKVGIGLRIVKNIIELHHGKIVLHSTIEKGSQFMLYLPKGKEHYKHDIVEWGTPPPSSRGEQLYTNQPTDLIVENPNLSKLTLLIIEDNKEIRKYICSLFSQEYHLWEATDGEEGIQLAKEKLPDLVLSDVLMPIKDGFECCREIRSCPLTAHIPIILLTAKAEDSDRIHGALQGADDYIMKPFNPELLQTRVKILIAQRSQLKQIYTKALMLKENLENKDEPNDFIEKVISIIEANLSDTSFTTATIASEMNMSLTTFYRKLKQHTNLSITEVIRSIRISKAASLLLTRKFPIQEVAEMVGFNDLPTFRKYFVKQFGMLPSHYLDAVANQSQ